MVTPQEPTWINERFDQQRQQFLEKPLPSSEDSERAILGAILLDINIMTQVVGKLEPEDFYSPLNRKVYEAMLTLFSEGTQVDPITICEQLKKDGSPDGFGGITTIANLSFGLPHFSDVSEYITIIKEKSTYRKLVRICSDISSRALSEGDELTAVLDAAESAVYSLRAIDASQSAIRLEEAIDQSINLARLRAQAGGAIVGIPTGFLELDMKLQGLMKANYIVVAARPRVGKTALLGRILSNIVLQSQQPTLMFSMEMSARAISDRIICAECDIDNYNLRSGNLSDDDWSRINVTRASLSEAAGFYINDTRLLTTLTVRSEIRRVNSKLRKQGKPPLAVVALDHIGLMRNATEKRGRTREGEVSDISKDLMAISKEFDCTVVALSQLNRKSEERSDHRPAIADLRESGSLEQDADIVCLLYREDVYQTDPSLYNNTAELTICKNRDGPEGVVRLHFARKSAKFSDYSQVEVEQPVMIHQPNDFIL